MGQPRLGPQQASFHLWTLAGPRWSSQPAPLATPASKDLACLSRAPTAMFRQWSVQSEPAPRRPKSQAASEELWEQEVERLCASRTPVRMLPYAMADKRFIRWVPLRRHCTEPLWGGGSTRGCTCQMDDPSPRSCRELREPEGVKSSWWQPWYRRRQVARQHLREAAQRLARGFRLWEGALYEIGGRTPCRPALPTSLISLSILVHPSDSSSAHLAG